MSEILDEAVVSEIESRPWFWPAHDEWRETPLSSRHVILTVAERDSLCATVKHLRAELAEEKRLRAELKQIAQIGISEVSSLGATLKDNALIDFRLRAIQLCKDKAAEWAKQADEAQARGIQVVADGKASRALAAKELATELEKL